MWVGWESWAEELVLRADRDPEMGVFGIEGGGEDQTGQGGRESGQHQCCVVTC